MTGAVSMAASLAAVLACLGLAVADARRRRLPRGWLALLLAAGAARRLSGAAGWEDTASALLLGLAGAVCGLAPVAAAIAWAEWRARRWPAMPGDALLLAAAGFLLGPVGLGWALLLGASAAAAHGACLQRRRGRPLRNARAPLAPGMAVGTAAVLAAIHAGLLGAGPA